MKARIILAVLAGLLFPSVATASSLVGWGYNGNGELAGGYKSSAQLPIGSIPPPGILEGVSPSGHYTLALTSEGTYGIGGNQAGQLGTGDRHNSTIWRKAKVPRLVEVKAGGGHAVGRTATGEVWAWGGNSYGTCGNGETGKGVEGPACPTPLKVAGITGAVEVEAGGPVDLALLADGTVMGWGSSSTGALGTTADQPLPIKLPLTEVAKVRAGGEGFAARVLAIKADGSLWALGDNRAGQLGPATTAKWSVTPVRVPLPPVVNASTSQSHSVAWTSDGNLYAWGRDVEGELGVPVTTLCGTILCSRTPVQVPLTGVTDAGVGLRFSVAVASGLDYGFGENKFRQLGNSTTANTATPVPVMSLALTPTVYVGEWHTLALTEGPVPPPTIRVVPGVDSLFITWVSQETKLWHVEWRVVTHPKPIPFGPSVSIPAAATGYTVTGLTPGTLYEVLVTNQHFGTRVVTGTPLAASLHRR